MRLGLFMAFDAAAHWLHDHHLLHARPLGWICDRFDLWLGVPPEALYRKKADLR